MRSIGYLLLTSLKNTLLELKRKPAKLVMVLLVVALICAMPFVGDLQARQAGGGQFLDIAYLKAAYLLFLLLFVGMAIARGLSKGDTFFEMSDVNMLFVSPVSPRKILIYGLIRMFKTAFWAGFFLLFQYGNIARGFDVGYDAILWMLGGFMLAMVVCQILSLMIYSLTSGRERAKRTVKIIAFAAFAPFVAAIAGTLIRSAAPMDALSAIVHAPMLDWVPIAGWGAGGVLAIITGQIPSGAMLLGGLAASGALMVVVVLRSNADYYEDVLVATETASDRKRAAKEGSVDAASGDGRRVKVSREGLSGVGARALFGKHLRESQRENRFLFIGIPSLTVVGGAILMAVFMRGEEGAFLVLLSMLLCAQTILIGTGRGLKETYRHYIYLIPEPATKKLVWSNLELVLRVLIEGALIFGIGGSLIGQSIGLILTSIACYALFSLLLIAVNFMSMRWTKADLSQGLMVFYYFIAVILVMLPGIVLAIVSGISAGLTLGLLALCTWELFAAIACFALSRGVLSHCDIQVMGQQG